MAKQLLIETGFCTNFNISNELKESLAISKGKGDVLVVRNVPCTILNRENQNGRIYTTEGLREAIENAKQQILTKQLLCQADEHPEGSFVAPTHASHVVTNVYIKENVEVVVEGEKGRWDVLFMDWEVLNTEEGKNLKALIEADCSLGTSIRGVGDMNGKTVINYELLGVDVVSNPSSGTFTRMPVKESVVVDIKKENALNEAFTVEAETIDTLTDVNSASQLLNQIGNDHTTTMTKSSLKFDSEINPDTGAETTVAILTTNTSDDVNDLNQALQLAGAKMASNVGTTDSVTISRIEEEDADANANKESVEMEEDTPIETQASKVTSTERDGNDLNIVGDLASNSDMERIECDSPIEAVNLQNDLANDFQAQGVAVNTPEGGAKAKEIISDKDDMEVVDDHQDELVDSCEKEMLIPSDKQEPASDKTADVANKQVLNASSPIHKRCFEASDFDFDFPGDLTDYSPEELDLIQKKLPDILIIKVDMSDEDAKSYEKVLEVFSKEFGLPLKGAKIRSFEDLSNGEEEEDKQDDKTDNEEEDKKKDSEDEKDESVLSGADIMECLNQRYADKTEMKEFVINAMSTFLEKTSQENFSEEEFLEMVKFAEEAFIEAK